jgi:hypothetical protein
MEDTTMADMVSATLKTFDLFEDAAARRPSLCRECLHPVEPANETELQPGGRGQDPVPFCRRCWLALFAFAPNCEGV